MQAAPGSVDTLDTYAVILLNTGDARKARMAMDKALAQRDDSPTVLFHSAQIDAALGRLDSAREVLRPLVQGRQAFPEKTQAEAFLREIDQGI